MARDLMHAAWLRDGRMKMFHETRATGGYPRTEIYQETAPDALLHDLIIHMNVEALLRQWCGEKHCWVLEGMALRNLAVGGAARALGVPAKPISPEVARLTKQELGGLKALPMVWDDLMAKLRATDPALFASRAG